MQQDHERDEWLMAQVAIDRRDALEPLVRRYAGPLLTFIERMVGDRHRSEELLQDVFLTLWKKRRRYTFPRPFKAWLYAIALNHCRTSFRSRALVLLSLDKERAAVAREAVPPPEDAAIATETAALVAMAITRLPAQQRAVVVLRIWEGLSYAQIAALLDRTEATIRAHMHHGLTRLRAYLEPRLR